jgi:hypothetical protein
MRDRRTSTEQGIGRWNTLGGSCAPFCPSQPDHLRPSFQAPFCATFYGMDQEYWTKQLREAEAELEAAKTLSAVNAAAKKLQRAKAELKALEGEPATPKPRATRASRAEGASS